MRGKIVIITSIVLVCSIAILGFQLYRYCIDYPVYKVDKEVKTVKKKVKIIEEKINKKNEEKTKLANDNSEKVAILEVWENAVNELDS